MASNDVHPHRFYLDRDVLIDKLAGCCAGRDLCHVAVDGDGLVGYNQKGLTQISSGTILLNFGGSLCHH